MELFKSLLFGISGLSMIFWVAVIGLWHADMFPRIFSNDSFQSLSERGGLESSSSLQKSSINLKGALRPFGDTKGLANRGKYSRKSFVVADFNPVEEGYGVNRLYVSILLSLSAMSFIVLGYGLHSAFNVI